MRVSAVAVKLIAACYLVPPESCLGFRVKGLGFRV